MSAPNPNSANPLFPNPTKMPDSYQKEQQNKKFNNMNTSYGKNEMTSRSGAPVSEEYRKQQSERKNADRYGMRRKK